MTCFDFRPGLGGMAAVGHELARALNRRDDTVVRVIAPARPGAASFDEIAGVDVVRAPMGSKPLSSVLPYYRSVRREVRDWSPDAVVNLLWLPDGVASRLALRGTSIPYHVFAHGVEVLESKRSLRKRIRGALVPLKRRVFNEAARALPVSHATGTILSSFGVRADRIEVVHGGVDPDEFFPAPRAADLVERYGLEGKRVFLTLARLHAYKGVDVAIDAFEKLARENLDVVYLVCGDGPDRPRLEEHARAAGVADKVVFTGTVPQERLRDHYNLCDAFVLLPRAELATPDLEGFGLVFLEAAACGKPSIAGRSGGVSDSAGETAWMVEPLDRAAVLDAMREVVRSPADAARRGAAARERALASFTWDALATKLVAGICEASPSTARAAAQRADGRAA
jgi:phosphatidyl-myo-inositol dimannoside synthase